MTQHFSKEKHTKRVIPVLCDVITIAAINLNKKSYYDKKKGKYINNIEGKPKHYEALTKSKIRLMLSLAIDNNVDNIILGAWGCGVFKNEPKDMAEMFKEVLVDENYAKSFDNVVFAIINDRNSRGNNFEAFNETFKDV